MRDNVTACGAIMVHEHETTARMVAKQSTAKTPKVFTVIREPCQRFASAFEYIRSFGMRTDSFMNSKMAKLQNKTSKLQVGWSSSALIRMKKGDPIHGMANAADWARLLLTNATYRQVEWADLMPSLDYKHAHAFLKDVLMISKQIWLVAPSTFRRFGRSRCCGREASLWRRPARPRDRRLGPDRQVMLDARVEVVAATS